MADHPVALDASPHDRRALRFKVIAFYAKWEPQKSTMDVVDLVEWALDNGVEVFNAKLKGKYGEDLHSVSASSFIDLALESQLKVFYSEYDSKKPQKEIDDVSVWARNRPDGVQELNSRLEKKYGENLNTMAFGGRLHLRVLLQHYLTRVDPLSASDAHISDMVNFASANGSTALMKQLLDKYKVPLHLSVAEIEGREHEIELVPSASVVKGDTRPAVMSLMRGQVQPIVNGVGGAGGAAVAAARPHSAARRPLSVALSVGSQGAGVSANKYKLTVSEDAEMKGLLEVYYAKHNPEKLSEIESVMRYVRGNGPDALNKKLMDRYGEDLNGLKKEYDEYSDLLVAYYAEVEPSKTNIDDVATWAIVHGIQPLSERLKKKYGKGLFEHPDQMQLEQLDPESLKARIRQFYEVNDPQNPKSESDLDIILHWVLASSVDQLNIKLQGKYGKTLNDLPPLTVGSITIGTGRSPMLKPQSASVVAKAATTTTTSTTPAVHLKPEPMGGKLTPARAITPPAGAPTHGRHSRANSFASIANDESADNIDTQVSHLREISSGRFDGLAAQIRAFYRAHDPELLKNKEQVDLMYKWTFKHGVAALNKKFRETYGRTLDEINVTEDDVEADEAEDVVGGDPNW